jgi:hypothetical protein
MATEEEIVTVAGGREIARARRAIEQRVRGGTLQPFYGWLAMYKATRSSTGRNHHHPYDHHRSKRGSKSTAAMVELCRREEHHRGKSPREERENERERARVRIAVQENCLQ